MALPLVHAARHNDVKPLLGRELMILTHDDDDDDVCMYVCNLGRDSMSLLLHMLILRMFHLRFVHLRTPHV